MGRHLLSIIPTHTTLRFECAGGSTTIVADPEQIRMVILELVANASEALDEKSGSITVRTGVRSVERPSDYLACTDPETPGGLYVWLEVGTREPA